MNDDARSPDEILLPGDVPPLLPAEQWAAWLREQAKRERYILAMRRAAPVTVTLLALNLAVFALVTWIFQGPPWGSGSVLLNGIHLSDLVAVGAKFNPAIERGAWWRLVSATFLHIGLLHVAANMYSLWNLGRVLENLWGRLEFLGIYLGAGLAGSVASWLYPRDPHVPAAGASGAVFGLVGAGLVLGLKYRRALPAQLGRRIFANLALWGGLFLGLGFVVSFIDNSAHVGGLVGGLVLAALIPARSLVDRPVPGPADATAPRPAPPSGPWAVLPGLVLAGVFLWGLVDAGLNLAVVARPETRLRAMARAEYRSETGGYSLEVPLDWRPQGGAGSTGAAAGSRDAVVFFMEGPVRDGQGFAPLVLSTWWEADTLEVAVQDTLAQLRSSIRVRGMETPELSYSTGPGLQFARCLVSFELRVQSDGDGGRGASVWHELRELRYVVQGRGRYYVLTFRLQPDREYDLWRADEIFQTFRVY